MVDDQDTDNPVVDQPGSSDRPAWRLGLLLLGGFRELVDEAHRRLAQRGHPDARPAHGFALQAVGSGATASEVAARLGVSKQAAAKTIAALEAQGYVARTADPADARRRTVVVSARGHDFLAASAAAFEEVVAGWRETAGPDVVDGLYDGLLALVHDRPVRLDVGAWSS